MSESPPASPPQWEVHIEAPDHRAYAWDALVVTVFEGPTSVDAALAIQDFHRVQVMRHDRISSLTLIAGRPPLQIDPEVRRIASEIARESAANAVAGAVVVSAEGWVPTIYRSVITGLHLLARVKTPHRVFTCVPDAIEWLCQQPRQTPRVTEHKHAILAACARSGVV